MKNAHIVRSFFSLRGWAIFSPSPLMAQPPSQGCSQIRSSQECVSRAQNINVNFQLSPMKGNKYKTGGAYAKAGYKNLA